MDNKIDHQRLRITFPALATPAPLGVRSEHNQISESTPSGCRSHSIPGAMTDVTCIRLSCKSGYTGADSTAASRSVYCTHTLSASSCYWVGRHHAPCTATFAPPAQDQSVEASGLSKMLFEVHSVGRMNGQNDGVNTLCTSQDSRVSRCQDAEGILRIVAQSSRTSGMSRFTGIPTRCPAPRTQQVSAAARPLRRRIRYLWFPIHRRERRRYKPACLDTSPEQARLTHFLTQRTGNMQEMDEHLTETEDIEPRDDE